MAAGEVAFDNTPLVEAVAEMNRYSTVRLVVEDPAAAPTVRHSIVFVSQRPHETSEYPVSR